MMKIYLINIYSLAYQNQTLKSYAELNKGQLRRERSSVHTVLSSRCPLKCCWRGCLVHSCLLVTKLPRGVTQLFRKCVESKVWAIKICIVRRYCTVDSAETSSIHLFNNNDCIGILHIRGYSLMDL